MKRAEEQVDYPGAVARRNNPAVFRSTAETVERAPRGERNLADGLLAVAFVGQECSHHANHIRTTFDEDDAGIVAHGFEGLRFVGNLHIGWKVAGNQESLIVLRTLKKSAVDSLLSNFPR